jgi:hypothetical protein
MLSFIGLIAIIFVAVKYFPEIIKFSIKAFIVLLMIWFLFGTLAWIFGISLAIHINESILQLTTIGV